MVPIESGNEIDFLNVSNTADENIMEIMITSYCGEPVMVQLTGVLKYVTLCIIGFICSLMIVKEKTAYNIAYTENKTQDVRLTVEEDFELKSAHLNVHCKSIPLCS